MEGWIMNLNSEEIIEKIKKEKGKLKKNGVKKIGLFGSYAKDEQKKNSDAKKFIQILETADGGCSYCVEDLLELFIKKFPQHKSLAEKKLKSLKLKNKVQ